MIRVGPVVAPLELPCGHANCGVGQAELHKKDVAQESPLCRAELPPWVDLTGCTIWQFGCGSGPPA